MPAHKLEYAHFHIGFIAQKGRQALTDARLDAVNDDEKHSVWALFSCDPDADLFMLRSEEFVALLTFAMQDLNARVAAL